MSTAMDNTTALTAKNRSGDIDGATLVYRRFGNSEPNAPPLLCLQHFDRLATDRDGILLDNRGVGASTTHRFGPS